jgi:hypothetical protein
MSINYLPPVTHVIPLTTIRRERRLPVPGTVTVRVGQKVQAADAVAEAEIGRRHFFLDIARGLGIPERQVAQYLAHARGDRVDAGEVIAGPVGFSRRTVRAPADGRIAAISGGRVLLEVHGEAFGLRAGFPGTVTATDGTTVVTIETTGALIQAVWGNGRQDYGMMRLVGENSGDRLQTDQLDSDLRGAVLVAGTCDHPAPLHQAIELSVRGVILGSLTSDLIPVAQRLPYPVIVTEGFGHLPINPMAYGLMRSNAGREVALDARPAVAYDSQRPEVIIPLPATREMNLPGDVVPIARGLRVRLLRAPHQGAVGVVREVVEEAVVFPSGILARCAAVDLEGIGTETVPLANLEVLQ